MKTNTTNTVANLTLTEAVVEAVKELKVTKGNFSAHDVTEAVRAAVNAGEIALPGLEAKDNNAGIKYWVNHDDVKDVIAKLIDNGEMANLGLVNINYNGPFRVFEFGNATVNVDTDTTANTPAVVTPPVTNANVTVSPVEQRIDAYLAKAGNATLKQIQSALKVNGLTCKDLYDMVKGMDRTVTPGTADCYSTYVVE